MSTIRLSGVANDSIVDGKGLRYTVFTQGCPHHCPGCHNPQTHDFAGGYDAASDTLLETILANPLLDGITLSGGEPMCQAVALLPLAAACRAAGLNVWAYTGFLYEELLKKPDCAALLQETDVLVDGPFIEAQRSLSLQFCGSANQRIIDVRESLRQGKTVLFVL